MAGIGFVLRKLLVRDDLGGILRAYWHSAIIAVAPWLILVLALKLTTIFTVGALGVKQVDEFLAIIIYTFVFSFILSSALYMLSARYVSDCLFLRDLSPIPGIMISSLFFLLFPAIAISGLFFTFYANMSALTIVLSVFNFVLLCETWIIMLYLGCLRDFRAITYTWCISGIILVFCSIVLGRAYGVDGILTGVNCGLVYLVYGLTANIFAEYHFRYRPPKEFHFYYKYYKELFWSGFFLFAGMWVDKIIMWSAPEAKSHLNHLWTYPPYDGAMLNAYITVIPVMALFIFSLETNFYEPYIRYINYIERNAPLFLLEEEQQNIFKKVKENGRSFLVLQGALTIIVIIFAPTLFEWTGTDMLQLGIFRLGSLGYFFGALNLFIVILFSYFDSQDNMLRTSSTMFFSNVIFTFISLKMGFPYYGYGFCLSMIMTFFMGSFMLVRFLDKLNFHIFITNIVKRQNVRAKFEERPK